MAPNRKGTATERNRRKRKRKPVDFSSSESSSESSSDGEAASTTAPTVPEPSEPSEESSSSSSSSDSDTDSEKEEAQRASASTARAGTSDAKGKGRRTLSRSPSPVSAPMPSFLPDNMPGNSDRDEKEKQLKERFQKLWMATIADEFKADLDEIRKEPGLTQSRLSMLIDSLSSGADLFSSKAGSEPGDINEMELILEAVDMEEEESATLHV